jgi:hypothetical protein
MACFVVWVQRLLFLWALGSGRSFARNYEDDLGALKRGK